MTRSFRFSKCHSRRTLGRTEAIASDQGLGKANHSEAERKKCNARIDRACLQLVAICDLVCAEVLQHAQVAVVRQASLLAPLHTFALFKGSSDCSSVESKTRSSVHARNGIKKARTRVRRVYHTRTLV